MLILLKKKRAYILIIFVHIQAKECIQTARYTEAKSVDPGQTGPSSNDAPSLKYCSHYWWWRKVISTFLTFKVNTRVIPILWLTNTLTTELDVLTQLFGICCEHKSAQSWGDGHFILICRTIDWAVPYKSDNSFSNLFLQTRP